MLGLEASMDDGSLFSGLPKRALARKEGEIAAVLRISPSCVSKWTKRKRDGLGGRGSDRVGD
jgi:hypothetical protein